MCPVSSVSFTTQDLFTGIDMKVANVLELPWRAAGTERLCHQRWWQWLESNRGLRTSGVCRSCQRDPAALGLGRGLSPRSCPGMVSCNNCQVVLWHVHRSPGLPSLFLWQGAAGAPAPRVTLPLLSHTGRCPGVITAGDTRDLVSLPAAALLTPLRS